MFKKYSLTTLAFLLAITLLLVGCSNKEEEGDNEQLKADLIAAISKQSDIQTYVFHGEAELQLDWPALIGQSQDPLTSSLTSILTNGKVAWRGVADEQAPRVEVDLTFSPHQFQGNFEVPAMINHNKLYIQIPLLATSEDEYLTYDLEPGIANVSFVTFMQYLAEAADETYYELIENEASSDRTIAIHINEQNIEDIISKLNSQVPSFITDLDEKGIINDDQANAWREKVTHSEIFNIIADQLDQPGVVSFTLNEDGFIISQSLKLYFANQSIEMSHELDQINEAVTFNKPIPEHTRSIADILNVFQ